MCYLHPQLRSLSEPIIASDRRHLPPPPRAADRPSQCFQPRQNCPAGQPPTPNSAAHADPRRRGYTRGAKFPPLWADLLKGRTKGRDWTALKVLRARSSARSHSTAVLPVPAKLIERSSLRRKDPPIGIVGGVGAAENVECLLEIAIVRKRSPISGKKRLVTGVSDGGLFEHRYRLGPLPRDS